MRSEKNRIRFFGRGILYGLGALAFAAFFALLFGWILMLLWNWLMPAIFGLTTIGYFQAWGLILISHLLFRGHGPGGRAHPRDRGERERFTRFGGPHPSREDREAFKREFKSRMRHYWEESDHEECSRDSGESGKDMADAADGES